MINLSIPLQNHIITDTVDNVPVNSALYLLLKGYAITWGTQQHCIVLIEGQAHDFPNDTGRIALGNYYNRQRIHPERSEVLFPSFIRLVKTGINGFDPERVYNYTAIMYSPTTDTSRGPPV